jgi:hypothetical protein
MSTIDAPAPSSKFLSFAIVFAIATPIIYVLCDLMGWPLFTFHPATGRLEWGYTLPRRGEGPVMYWYGWTATTLIGAGVLGFLASLVPTAARKLPLALAWLLPILAIPPLVWSLMPFWTR